jgi:hypothetical protein
MAHHGGAAIAHRHGVGRQNSALSRKVTRNAFKLARFYPVMRHGAVGLVVSWTLERSPGAQTN